MSNNSTDGSDQSLRCGILVIGSLLWQIDDECHRENWRNKRLNLMAKQHVKVPIRYGRQSQSWGQSFTMILDAEASPGQAVLIPCNATICSIEELIEEVKWLWSAEANQDISDEFHKKWGCVGALFGPTAIYEKFDKKWCKHFQAASPAQFPAIDSFGKLNIPWPQAVEGETVKHFDIILATATMPNPANNKPDARQIATKWLDQSNGYERYFFKNVQHAIRTHDDHSIWSTIKTDNPSWLNSEDYKDAVEQLKFEVL